MLIKHHVNIRNTQDSCLTADMILFAPYNTSSCSLSSLKRVMIKTFDPLVKCNIPVAGIINIQPTIKT